jgi:hypothetical protein
VQGGDELVAAQVPRLGVRPLDLQEADVDHQPIGAVLTHRKGVVEEVDHLVWLTTQRPRNRFGGKPEAFQRRSC